MEGEIIMQDIIIDYLGQAKIGRKQSFRNIALFPLISTYSVDLDYILLDEALSEGAVEIVEKDEGVSHFDKGPMSNRDDLEPSCKTFSETLLHEKLR
jgi:hypothetical protein